MSGAACHDVTMQTGGRMARRVRIIVIGPH